MAGLTFNIFGHDVSASAALRRIQGQAHSTATGVGSSFKKMGGMLAGGLAAAGIGSFIKDSVQLEAQFSKTMTTLQASSGASAKSIAELNALAMKLGSNTKFSANEAADAMLELSKAGISTKDIMSGAADGTLLLATAGGTELATAATIASNAMNTFNLRGADMAKIAAALAGGANASSASVESLGAALSQVGPGAVNAGLSLNETVGVLSAFDAAGIKGSDAGTSLKTMLARLIPSTDAAAGAMEDLHLNFVKADGSFKSVSAVAEQLHNKLGPLSEAQRAQALQTIFGSDATRAATVLMKQGADGLAKYITATKDQGAAQKMADAAMSGTSGALETLSGAMETLKLQVGTALAPVIQGLAKFLSGTLIPAISSTIRWMQDHASIVKTVAIAVGTLIAAILAAKIGLAAYNLVTGISAVLAGEQAAATGLQTLALGAQKVALATTTAAQWLFNAAMNANPILLVVTAIAALVTGLVIAYKRSETFRNIVQTAFAGVKLAVSIMWRSVKPILEFFKAGVKAVAGAVMWLWHNVVQPAVNGIKAAWHGISEAVRAVWGVIKGVFDSIKSGINNFKQFIEIAVKAISGVWHVMGDGLQWVYDHTIGPILNFIQGRIEDIKAAINALNPFAGIDTEGIVNQFNAENPPHNAQGTGFFSGGRTGINELGQESVLLPTGSRIYPASVTASRDRMSNGGQVKVTAVSDPALLRAVALVGDRIAALEMRINGRVVGEMVDAQVGRQANRIYRGG